MIVNLDQYRLEEGLCMEAVKSDYSARPEWAEGLRKLAAEIVKRDETQYLCVQQNKQAAKSKL